LDTKHQKHFSINLLDFKHEQICYNYWICINRIIVLSFYSIGPVLCNVLNPGCTDREYYLAVLPYFLAYW